MAKDRVGEWLEHQFLKWQSDQGERQTLDAFAEYIGVTRSALNKWMNGNRTPNVNYANLIADKLGPEVYDLLGIPRPDPRLRAFIEIWGKLPEPTKDKLFKQIKPFVITAKG